MLEPIVDAATELVGALTQRDGETDTDEGASRRQALMLISPVVLALLHQDSLGGAVTHPMDLDQLVADLASRPLT